MPREQPECPRCAAFMILDVPTQWRCPNCGLTAGNEVEDEGSHYSLCDPPTRDMFDFLEEIGMISRARELALSAIDLAKLEEN